MATILHHALSNYISSLGLFISKEIFCNARNGKVSRRNEIKSNLQRIFYHFRLSRELFLYGRTLMFIMQFMTICITSIMKM